MKTNSSSLLLKNGKYKVDKKDLLLNFKLFYLLKTGNIKLSIDDN